MTSPEERRETQLNAIAESPFAVEVSPVDAYRRLLTYFEENEPAVADAIRFGLRRSGFDSGAWHINYPEGHPKR
jgi:hypothetical protein